MFVGTCTIWQCARDCQDLREMGFTESGVYIVTPAGTSEGIEVYCDMYTDNGGWLVCSSLIKLEENKQIYVYTILQNDNVLSKCHEYIVTRNSTSQLLSISTQHAYRGSGKLQ